MCKCSKQLEYQEKLVTIYPALCAKSGGGQMLYSREYVPVVPANI